MANELRVTNTAGGTTYAIIRRLSDGYVWNGSAFAAWADLSIATYDIPLTSLGGDMYAADLPASLSASTAYRVQYYIQAGVAPATTDTLIETVEGVTEPPAPAAGSGITASTVILKARQILRDEAAGQYRFDDARLLAYLDDGQQFLLEERPDLRLTSTATLTTVGEVDALTDALHVGATWRLPLAQYVAARALEEDDPESANAGVAAGLMAQFMGKVRGNG